MLTFLSQINKFHERFWKDWKTLIQGNYGQIGGSRHIIICSIKLAFHGTINEMNLKLNEKANVMKDFEGTGWAVIIFEIQTTSNDVHFRVCLTQSTRPPLKLTRCVRLTSKWSEARLKCTYSCHGKAQWSISMALVYVYEVSTSGPDMGTSHANTRVAVPLTPHPPDGTIPNPLYFNHLGAHMGGVVVIHVSLGLLFDSTQWKK